VQGRPAEGRHRPPSIARASGNASHLPSTLPEHLSSRDDLVPAGTSLILQSPLALCQTCAHLWAPAHAERVVQRQRRLEGAASPT
jgi:hypothetical protein